MALFSFFKKTKKTGKDSTVSSTELLDDKAGSSTDDLIQTELSYHPDWDVPKEQQYVFRFLSNELEALKANQLSLSGIDIDFHEGDEAWLVKAFFRSSLDQPITMGKVELLLMSEDNKVLASQQFDLAVLDEIPAKSDRPWVFAFDKQNQKVAEMPGEGWKLAFNVQSLVPHQLELAPTWEEALTADQKEALKKIVEKLPKLKDREVNFSGFQAKPQENGSLAISLFIRNGHSQHITVDQLPLEVSDATGDLVARGSFTLDSLEVKANTSKAWTFIFPAEMIQKQQADFTRWTVRVPQHS